MKTGDSAVIQKKVKITPKNVSAINFLFSLFNHRNVNVINTTVFT